MIRQQESTQGNPPLLCCHQLWCMHCIGRASTYNRRTYCVGFLPFCLLGFTGSLVVDCCTALVILLIILTMGIGTFLLILTLPIFAVEGLLILLMYGMVFLLCYFPSILCRRFWSSHDRADDDLGAEGDGPTSWGRSSRRASDRMERDILRNLINGDDNQVGLPV